MRRLEEERAKGERQIESQIFPPFLLDVWIEIGLQASSETYERNCETALEWLEIEPQNSERMSSFRWTRLG